MRLLHRGEVERRLSVNEALEVHKSLGLPSQYEKTLGSFDGFIVSNGINTPSTRNRKRR
jgi:hypothetical protein